MKRKLYTCIFALFAVLTVKAQNNLSVDKIAVKVGEMDVEDSDSTIKSDYFSAVSFVRSGTEIYSVKSGVRYKSDILYAIVQNTSNTAMDHPDYCRISGEILEYFGNWYAPDESQMKAIAENVFPNCAFGKNPTKNANNQQSLCIYMAVDPDTEKVIDMKFWGTIYLLAVNRR